MKIDIYSFNDGSKDYFVEMHTSSSKIKKLNKQPNDGNPTEKTKNPSERAEQMARAALEAQKESGGAEVSRIVIDKNWKKVQVIDVNGNKVTRTWKNLKKAPNESTNPPPSSPPPSLQAALLASQLEKSLPTPATQENKEAIEEEENPEGTEFEGEGWNADDPAAELAENPELIPTESPSTESTKTDESTATAETQKATKTPSITLVASIADTPEAKKTARRFIEQGFRPVTPMEKIWGSFASLRSHLSRAAHRDNRRVGAFDFAVHLFSQDVSRDQLAQKELTGSMLLNELSSFHQEKGIGTDDVPRLRQAAKWSRSIEKLREGSRREIISKYGKISADIQKAVESLKPNDSVLVPISCYADENGLRSDSFRLIRITHTHDHSRNHGEMERVYKIEFIDDAGSTPITNVHASKMTLEDFYKPLVDIQLSASFAEVPDERLDRIIMRTERFADRHPKLTAWLLMGKSQKTRRDLVVALQIGAQNQGEVTSLMNAERSNLKEESLLAEIFAPLVAAGTEVQLTPELYGARTTGMFGKRHVDSYLSVLDRTEQAKVEAESLFQFYYLYEECLADDPTTMQVMESGLKRVSDLYAQLDLVDERTTTMLEVISRRIETAKGRMHTRQIDLSDNDLVPNFPEQFSLKTRGVTVDFASQKAVVEETSSFIIMEQMENEESQQTINRNRAEMENKATLERIDLLNSFNAYLDPNTEVCESKSEEIAHTIRDNIGILKDNIDNFISALNSTLQDVDGSQELCQNLMNIKATIEKDDLTMGELQQAKENYNQMIKTAQQLREIAIEEEKIKLQESLSEDWESIRDQFEDSLENKRMLFTQNKVLVVQKITDKMNEIKRIKSASYFFDPECKLLERVLDDIRYGQYLNIESDELDPEILRLCTLLRESSNELNKIQKAQTYFISVSKNNMIDFTKNDNNYEQNNFFEFLKERKDVIDYRARYKKLDNLSFSIGTMREEVNNLKRWIDSHIQNFTELQNQITNRLTLDLQSLSDSMALTVEQRTLCDQCIVSFTEKLNELRSQGLNVKLIDKLTVLHVLAETNKEIKKIIDGAIVLHNNKLQEVDANRLPILEDRINKISVKYKDPLSEVDRERLRHELSEIFAELPTSNLAWNGSFWSGRNDWLNSITNLKVLVVKSKSATMEFDPVCLLQSALCDAISYRINESDQNLVKFKVIAPKLNNGYLHFTIPAQQRQHLALLELINKLQNKTSYEIQKFDPAFFYQLGGGDSSPENGLVYPVPLKNLSSATVMKKSAQSTREDDKPFDLFGDDQIDLLNQYVQECVESEDNSEYYQRIEYGSCLGLSSDVIYKLMTTNSSFEHVGLQELIMMMASPEMVYHLNNEENAVNIQLRRIIANRMFHPGHLEYFVSDDQRLQGALSALNGVIEATSANQPEAYITLMRMKAALLIAHRENARREGADIGPLTQQIKDLINEMRGKLATDDDAFTGKRLQMHAAILAVSAQSYLGIASEVETDELSDLLSSWMAYRGGIKGLGYIDKQEEDTINRFFFGKIFPQWNKLEQNQKNEILQDVLRKRDLLGADATIDFTNKGEFYTFELNGQHGNFNIIKGELALNGVGVSVMGEGLPTLLWKNFPIYNEAYSPTSIQRKQIGERGVYQFAVEGLPGLLFQADPSTGIPVYSVLLAGDQTDKWYEYAPLEIYEETSEIEEESDASEETSEESDVNDEDHDSFLKGVGELLLGTAKEVRNRIKQVKKDLRDLGESLEEAIEKPVKNASIPRDIMNSGVWLLRDNPTQGLVLSPEGVITSHVALSHKTQGKGVEARNISTIKAVVMPAEGGVELHLINNDKSQLYRQLCGLTAKENIKIWADSKGVIQRVDLLDPVMAFERDSVSGKLMSQRLVGFFISEDQSVPVGDFSRDWSNYLILENDAGQRRMIMRQSGVATVKYLTPSGIVAKLLSDTEDVTEGAGFIDIELKRHPEKGWVAVATTPQANLYLGLASMEGCNFPKAIEYLRKAARSSPYSGAETAIIKAIFSYANERLSLEELGNRLLTSDDENANMLVDYVDAMLKYEPNLAQIAAAKLVALATLLQQDYQTVKDNLPDDEEVRKWMAFANQAHLSNDASKRVAEICQLTPSEMKLISLRYPTVIRQINPEDIIQGMVPSSVVHAAVADLSQKELLVAKDPLSVESDIPTFATEDDLISRLGSTRQTSSKEKVLAFHSGQYVIRHFKEMQQRIDALNGTTPEGRKELSKIIVQLNRFKDADPSTTLAIQFLRQLALAKLHQRLVAEPGLVQLQALRQACRQQLADLKNSRDEIKRIFDDAELQSIKNDLLSFDQWETLDKVMTKINEFTFSLMDPMNNKDIGVMSIQELSDGINRLQSEWHSTIESLYSIVKRGMKKRGAYVGEGEDLKIPESKQYRGKSGTSLSPYEVKAIGEWSAGDPRDYENIPPALSKIKFPAGYSLDDHLKELGKRANVPAQGEGAAEQAPVENEKYPFTKISFGDSTYATAEELLSEISKLAKKFDTFDDVYNKVNVVDWVSEYKLNEKKDIDFTTPPFSYWGDSEQNVETAVFDFRKNKDSGITLQIGVQSWEAMRLQQLASNLTKLGREIKRADKLRVESELPERKKDGFDKERMAAFLNSHETITYELPSSTEPQNIVDEVGKKDDEDIEELSSDRTGLDVTKDIPENDGYLLAIVQAKLIDMEFNDDVKFILNHLNFDPDKFSDDDNEILADYVSVLETISKDEKLRFLLVHFANQVPNISFEGLRSLTQLLVDHGKAISDENLVECGTQVQVMFDESKTAEEKRKATFEFEKLVDNYDIISKGYVNGENVAFFDNLSGEQLLEFDRLVENAERINHPGLDQCLFVLSNPSFNILPNAFHLFKDLLSKTLRLVLPLDVANECQRLELIIAERTIDSETAKAVPLISPKNTVVISGEGSLIFDKEMQTVEEGEHVCSEQRKIVESLRQKIIDKANTLSDDPKTANAERLRRLTGEAVVIDPERVFFAYARGNMESELKRLNPQLTDKDIKELRDLVTKHHIEAVKLQTEEKVLASLKMIEQFDQQFANNSSLNQRQEFNQFKEIVGLIRSSDTTAKETAEAFLNQIETKTTWQDSDYTPQKFADDVRDYLAQMEIIKKLHDTRRHYDVALDQDHTRAALAYEYTLGVVFKLHQIQEFTSRVGTPDIVSWLGTGFGKTFMAPGLARMMATGTNLVCVVDTKDLIPTTSKTRDSDSRAVYGQAAYRFDFTRDVDRSVENLMEIKYHLLDAIANEGYIVTSKEALGSLALQLLTWQRLGLDDEKYDKHIALAQDIVKIFKERGVALGDEIHVILNVIEALDYSEGERRSVAAYSEYYKTMSTIYSTIFRPTTDNTKDKFADRRKAISDKLKIAQNQQAQVNASTVQDAMRETAQLIVDEALSPDSNSKDPLYSVIKVVVKNGLVPATLVEFLSLQKIGEGETPALTDVPIQIQDLGEVSKRLIASLKENLSATFEKVMVKVGGEDFGINPENGLNICPYDKGRPQPNKEFDDIFQTLQTHYMWYTSNGIPVDGLKKIILEWQTKLEAEIPEFPGEIEKCPTNISYRHIFGQDAPLLRGLSGERVHQMALAAKNDPETICRFLELVVFPQTYIFPNKLGFNSMDLAVMFNKFGGYSGTVQTRGSWSRAVSNKDQPGVDAQAADNFRPIYTNPLNQDQYALPDIDSEAMKMAAKNQGGVIASLSAQLNEAKIDIKKFRAIVDVGGLFKELGALEMAKDILNQFKPNELEAVLIFDNESNLCILRRGSDRLEPFDSKTVPPAYDKRFTVYRQPQFTGIDIPQAQRAKALVTINEKTAWGDFEQGVGRLRKNKEGQTYSVIYRESLQKKINDDLKIAEANDDQEEMARIMALKKDGKIDVQRLTQHTENQGIQLRRYYAAVSEMEAIVKDKLRVEMCGSRWKAVYNEFQDMLFEESQKSSDQLLGIVVPTDPIEALNSYRKGLIRRIEKGIKNRDLAFMNQALLQAVQELGDYPFPDKNELPKSVIGTHGTSTRSVERAIEAEKAVEAEAEREVEAEHIKLQEKFRSDAHSRPELKWIAWSPANLFGGFIGKEVANVKSVDENGERFFSHLRGIFEEDGIEISTLFKGLMVTENMLQKRVLNQVRTLSLISTGQKSARSVLELCLEDNGKREYKLILLDVRDHGQVEKALGRARKIMTERFREGVMELAKDQKDVKLSELAKNEAFQALFGEGEQGQSDRDFLINMFGGELTLGQLATVSLRINMEGKYTASCGKLGLEDHEADAEARNLLVRKKFLCGEEHFTNAEKAVLRNLLTEECLKVADFDEIRRQMQNDGVGEQEIEQVLQQKQQQGIKDFTTLEAHEKEKIRLTAFALLKLYDQAVNANNPIFRVNVEASHVGRILAEVIGKMGLNSNENMPAGIITD